MKNKRIQKVNYSTISLPQPLIKKIKEKMEGTGMNSVSAYVSFILREILSSPDSLKKEIVPEKENIRRRLKNLGYI